MTVVPDSPGRASQRADVPLRGFTVALTAARRREELGSLLERRGARVVHAPAIRLAPLEDDGELLAATRACVDLPPDVVVATTGIGFRAWMEAADGWDLGEPLRERLGSAILLARGPKARGAIRAAGLMDHWSPESESLAETLDYLLSTELKGTRIAIQLHGEPLPDITGALQGAGADVVSVPVYRWTLPEDASPLERLVESIVARTVDCVVFTSAPAVAGLLSLAAEANVEEHVLDAFRGDVMAACVGPVTAERLERAGIATTQPSRARLGALVREIAAELPARYPTLRVAGHVIHVRGHAVVVDGEERDLPPGPMAILRVLAARPGVVVPRADLLGALPGGGSDEHAVEMAVARLRSVLGSGVIQTVVKRGYRLACEAGPNDDQVHERVRERDLRQ
ncbi:uroporphyrinogen-III synthase [Phytoactinopolyspora halophila]|uniref:uroporphyrinogen-III synthase n=1 Tax=Phytoactinopolyspora halophila TaxID=1981511 RepID=UPI00147968D1|nr:uroporphyrinogen-III synthase [Phytoactinopolyspora halophila]